MQPSRRARRSLPVAELKTAVLVPIEEWNRLQSAARPGLKALLLAPNARFENLVAKTRNSRRRAPVEFR